MVFVRRLTYRACQNWIIYVTKQRQQGQKRYMIFTIENIQGHDSMWDMFLNVKEKFLFPPYFSMQINELKDVKKYIIFKKKLNFYYTVGRN